MSSFAESGGSASHVAPTSISKTPPHFILGVISDTHGLLRAEALAALAPAQYILHAGDVGNIAILDALRAIAPVTAIRGNVDVYGPCSELPPTELVEVAGRLFYLVHSIHDLDISPTAAGVAAVISGHSHKPSVETRNNVLYLNPGSAGPRRFQLPVTVAMITIIPTTLAPNIIPVLWHPPKSATRHLQKNPSS